MTSLEAGLFILLTPDTLSVCLTHISKAVGMIYFQLSPLVPHINAGFFEVIVTQCDTSRGWGV